ncbi:MAG TPA: hypothetical protein VMF50_11740 [Candidatus Binataceae bacterium]|nr:hypothetical protein [Candidatus Binataceae bacterium]
MDEYIVEPDVIPWREGRIAGITFKCQVLMNGADGGPEALRFRFDPCPSVFAHMHLTSQFQLLLNGRMDFPKSTMKLRAIAVHYTDHNFPYGPFAVGDSHDMLVLHPKQGGLISMADHDARRQINLKGRHFYGSAAATDWINQPEFRGVRCKPLIPPSSGPYAVILECPPHACLNLPPAPYGRYELVLAGSASVSGRTLLPPGLRYVRHDSDDVSTITPMEAGRESATLMLLAFDNDACEGGLTGDRLSVAAAEAIERAI